MEWACNARAGDTLHRVRQSTGATGATAVEPGESVRRLGRSAPLIAGFWLVLAVNPLIFYTSRLDDPWVVVAYVLMVPFTAVYLGLLLAMRNLPLEQRGRLPGTQAWGGIALIFVLCFGISFGWGQDGLNLTAFAVLAAGLILPTRQTAVFVPVYSVLAYVLTLVVPGWDPDINVPLILLGAGFVMATLRQAIVSNIDLMLMREENESLLLDQERNRFARDLHDILGHSLTVITVKAELAGRLIEDDVARAADEVRDLERLSREALHDVRLAVQGYREITLLGEIARARSALKAAGVEADLPSSADEVEGPLRELFAWAIREGVTNVVRHARATRCTVELEAGRVAVRDDGGGPEAQADGNGLQGLRERAAAVGATVRVRQASDHGFVLEVVGP